MEGVLYYIFDRELEGEGLGGLWLRGVVSEEQTRAEMSSITRLSLVLMPLLLILAVIGGYIIAGRMLWPVRKISETAEEICNGKDPKKRIDVGEGQDEHRRQAEPVPPEPRASGRLPERHAAAGPAL